MKIDGTQTQDLFTGCSARFRPFHFICGIVFVRYRVSQNNYEVAVEERLLTAS